MDRLRDYLDNISSQNEKIEKYMSGMGPWHFLYLQTLRYLDIHRVLYSGSRQITYGDLRDALYSDNYSMYTEEQASVVNLYLSLFDLSDGEERGDTDPFNFKKALVKLVLYSEQDPYSYNTCIQLMVAFYTIEFVLRGEDNMVNPIEWVHLEQERQPISYRFYRLCKEATSQEDVRPIYSEYIDQFRTMILQQWDDVNFPITMFDLMGDIEQNHDSLIAMMDDYVADQRDPETEWMWDIGLNWLRIDMIGTVVTEEQFYDVFLSIRNMSDRVWPNMIREFLNLFKGKYLHYRTLLLNRGVSEEDLPIYDKWALKYHWAFVISLYVLKMMDLLLVFHNYLPWVEKHSTIAVTDSLTAEKLATEVHALQRRQDRMDEDEQRAVMGRPSIQEEEEEQALQQQQQPQPQLEADETGWDTQEEDNEDDDDGGGGGPTAMDTEEDDYD
jgi:hypothetical protein